MKNHFLFLIFIFCFTYCYPQSWQWANRMGGSSDSGPNNNEFLSDATVDSQGNTYVIGTIFPGADFGGTFVTQYGGPDIFVACHTKCTCLNLQIKKSTVQIQI